MDAMQKRKAQIVSLVHFGLTLCVALLAYYITPHSHSDLLETRIRHEIWSQFCGVILLTLQPFPIFIVWASQVVLHAIWLHSPIWLAATLTWIVLLISVPLWSYCFGIIFVKFDNWLNHFPVLGKRVF